VRCAIVDKNSIRLEATEPSLMHKLLVLSNSLQALPDVAIALAIGLNALIVVVFWLGKHDLSSALIVALGFLIASGVNWMLLRALPRTGRSYGPDKPPAFALAALLTLILAALSSFSTPVWLAIVVMGLVSLAAFYATWIEPFRLGVTRQHYTTAAWPKGGTPLRLLHIGDLHIERITARERRLNQLVQSLQPDIIVFSGDFVNLSYTYDPEAERAIRSVIGEWSAPLGVYCVPGTPSVEPPERVAAFVKGLPNLKLLINQWITPETPGEILHLLGTETTHGLATDRATLKKMMLLAPKSGLKLCLTHSPELAPEADAAGLDLYLCGHTHGGQIRLPLIGPLVTSSQLGRRFVMGRYTLARMTLYVTRGVGMEGLGAPRARFLCPPEIVLWEISGSG
jgi:uncharacterized protein